MLKICVYVIGLAYAATCSIDENVYPVGDCVRIDSNLIYCVAAPEELPIRLQPYIPELGGINCFEDTCDYLGGGHVASDYYNYAIACPQGMYEDYLYFEMSSYREWQCLDHGGDIKLTFDRLYNGQGFDYYWYIPIDVLWQADVPYPNWMWMLSDWRRKMNSEDYVGERFETLEEYIEFFEKNNLNLANKIILYYVFDRMTMDRQDALQFAEVLKLAHDKGFNAGMSYVIKKRSKKQ